MSRYMFTMVDSGKGAKESTPRPDDPTVTVPESKTEPDVRAKTPPLPVPQALVVGATGGVGQAMTTLLVSLGYHVFATCRKPTLDLVRLRRAGDATLIMPLDITAEGFETQLLEGITTEKLDIVIVCTGIFTVQAFPDLAIRDLMHEFHVNAVAPLMTIQAIQSKLKEGSKVMILACIAGATSSIRSGGLYGQRMAKAALNSAAVSLSKDLATRGAFVGLVDIGMVDTPMMAHIPVEGKTSPTDAAVGIWQRLEALDASTSGVLMNLSGAKLSF